MLEKHASCSRPPCATADLIEDRMTAAVLIQLFLGVAQGAARARATIPILDGQMAAIATANDAPMRPFRPAAGEYGGEAANVC